MKMQEIADRILTHLKRFEADKEKNVSNNYGNIIFYNVNTYAGKRYVYITYISYQGEIGLSKKDALAYLEKLDEGFIGRHFEALKQ